METIKKRSTSETGHMKNLMNLEDLLARYIALGARYNPANPDLQLANLQRLFQEGQMAMDRLTTAITMNNTATVVRSNLFDQLGPLSTSVVNYLMAGGVDKKILEDAKSLQRKIQGTRSTKKDATTEEEANGAAEAETDPNATENEQSTEKQSRSTAQLSYDLKLEHAAKLFSLVQNEPTYQPHEPELQVSALFDFLQRLREANTNKAHTDAELEAARSERSRVFYDSDKAIVPIALLSKAYAKAILGSRSEDFKNIRRIQFRIF